MAAPSQTTTATLQRVLPTQQSVVPTPFVSIVATLAALTAGPSAPTGGAVPRKPAVLAAEKLGAARPSISVIAALAALTVGLYMPTDSPSAPADRAILGRSTVLVVEKLDATRPEELHVPLCDKLIVRSGTKVGYGEFEASGGRLHVVGHAGVGIDSVDLAPATKHGILVVILPFSIFVAAAHVVPILLGVGALVVSGQGQRLGCRIGPIAVGVMAEGDSTHDCFSMVGNSLSASPIALPKLEAAHDRGSSARVWTVEVSPFPPAAPPSVPSHQIQFPPCASATTIGNNDNAVGKPVAPWGKLDNVEATGAKPNYAERLATACYKSVRACITSADGTNVIIMLGT
ncbi:hypothetical protein GUJ93_ZPchr0010g7362 [Zizania palustris]|uniref:D-isomer specific 2-hydroxyacid dehydrogenase catalytic domain-containing protein n=1 Tax=Zizania palustris TaxID=103762 RepID=A0A8J6BA26_ZIZPA|nr:hypothetical protein GUJ93_ZPchr0010g7362 [Zizania palustris]